MLTDPPHYYRLRSIAYLLLLLVSCGNSVARPAVQTPVARSLGFFAVDSLVRSTQLAGVDLHVRYAESTPTSIVLHIAFYNNGTSDLAFVSGVSASQAQLIGSTVATPTALSPSFTQGIAPAGTWLVNGANNGTLSFPPLAGDLLRFVFPGFPAVPIRFTLPLREAPEPSPPLAGQYRFAWEVAAQQPGYVLRINAVTVATTTLTIEIGLLDRGSVAPTRPLLPRDITLFDGRWSQLHAETNTSALGVAQVAGEHVVVRFPRPSVGEHVLMRVPGFPLIRLPLHADDLPAVATEADLPPSASPRPTPRPSPQAPVLNDEAHVWSDIQHLLDQLNTALSEHDRVAYLRVFAAEMEQAQATAFDQIMQLPLQNVQFALASPQPGGSPNNTPTTFDALPVTLHYAVRDIDPANVFVNDLRLSFRHDAVWHITAIAGDLPFWSYASTAAERVGPFWIFFRPTARTELPALAAEAQGAFEQVQHALPGRAKAVNVMFVTTTPEEFTTLTGRSGDRFVGVALSRYQVNASGVTITNQAFFLNGAAFQRTQSQNREQTITHEFTHMVLAPATMPFIPAWLVEGAAMDVSADFPLPTLKTWLHTHPEGMKLDDFSSITTFGQGDNSEQTLVQYAYAAYLTKYLIEVYGMDRFLALYDSFSTTPLPALQAALGSTTSTESRNAALGQLSQRLTPVNVQAVLGIDLATLERNFNTWLIQNIKPEAK